MTNHGPAHRTLAHASAAATNSLQSPPARRPPAPDRALDPAIHHQLSCMMPPSELRELYAALLTDVAQRSRRIRSLARSGELIAVRAEAHAIKGGCLTLGARELASLACALESAPLKLAAHFNPIHACSRLSAALASHLPANTPGLTREWRPQHHGL